MNLLRRRTAEPESDPLAALADNKLSARSITGRVLSATTATTVVAGVVPVGIKVTGANFPLVFLVIAAAYALFCVGYLAASRLHPPDDASSAFYSLIRHGLGRLPGVGAGWLAVTAYTALTLGLYGLIGDVLSPPLSELFGVTVPWEAIAIPAALLVGWLGLMRIQVGTRVLMVLATCEVVMILVATVANWTHPADGTAALAALDPHQLTASTPVIAAQAALAVLGYIGAELTVIHTEDARDGHRGVGRATVAVIAILVFLYVAAPAGLTVTLGVDGVAAAAQQDPGGVFVGTVRANLGGPAATIFQILFGSSVLAGAIAFHSATAKYCLYLGRDHAAPAILARTSQRHGSATIASVTQTILAVAAIIVVSSVDAEPVEVLFLYGGTAGAVGILTLLTLTAVATTIILLRARRSAASRAAAPAPGSPTGTATAVPGTRPGPRSTGRLTRAATVQIAASILFGALTTTVMIHFATLLGVDADSSLPGAVLLCYLAVFLAGVAWAAWHRRHPAEGTPAPIGADRP